MHLPCSIHSTFASWICFLRTTTPFASLPFVLFSLYRVSLRSLYANPPLAELMLLIIKRTSVVRQPIKQFYYKKNIFTIGLLRIINQFIYKNNCSSNSKLRCYLYMFYHQRFSYNPYCHVLLPNKHNYHQQLKNHKALH